MARAARATLPVIDCFFEVEELQGWLSRMQDGQRESNTTLADGMESGAGHNDPLSRLSEPVLIRSYFLTWREKTLQKHAFKKRLIECDKGVS